MYISICVYEYMWCVCVYIGVLGHTYHALTLSVCVREVKYIVLVDRGVRHFPGRGRQCWRVYQSTESLYLLLHFNIKHIYSSF